MRRTNRPRIQRSRGQEDLSYSEEICKILISSQNRLGIETEDIKAIPDAQYFEVIGNVCQRILIIFESQTESSLETREGEPKYLNSMVAAALEESSRLDSDQRKRAKAWLLDPRFNLFAAALNYWSGSNTAQISHLLSEHLHSYSHTPHEFNQTCLYIPLMALTTAISGNYFELGHFSNDLFGYANKNLSRRRKRDQYVNFLLNHRRVEQVYRRLRSIGPDITGTFTPIENISEADLPDKDRWVVMHRSIASVIHEHLFNTQVRVSQALFYIFKAKTEASTDNEQYYLRAKPFSDYIYDYLFGPNNLASHFIDEEHQEQQIKQFFKTLMLTLEYLTKNRAPSNVKKRLNDIFAGAPLEVFQSINTAILEDGFYNDIYYFLLGIVDDVTNLHEAVDQLYDIFLAEQAKLKEFYLHLQEVNNEERYNAETIGTTQIRREFAEHFSASKQSINAECLAGAERYLDEMLTVGRLDKRLREPLEEKFKLNEITVEEYVRKKRELDKDLLEARKPICMRYRTAALKDYEQVVRQVQEGYRQSVSELPKGTSYESNLTELTQQLDKQLVAIRKDFFVDELSGSSRSTASIIDFTEEDYRAVPVTDALVMTKTKMIDYKNLRFGSWSGRSNCLRKESEYYKLGIKQKAKMHETQMGLDYARMVRDFDEARKPALRTRRLATEKQQSRKRKIYWLCAALSVLGLIGLGAITALSLGATLPFTLPLSVPLLGALSGALVALGICCAARNTDSWWHKIKTFGSSIFCCFGSRNHKAAPANDAVFMCAQSQPVLATGRICGNSGSAPSSPAAERKFKHSVSTSNVKPASLAYTGDQRLFHRVRSAGDLSLASSDVCIGDLQDSFGANDHAV